jgi:hypothetical protein
MPCSNPDNDKTNQNKYKDKILVFHLKLIRYRNPTIGNNFRMIGKPVGCIKELLVKSRNCMILGNWLKVRSLNWW